MRVLAIDTSTAWGSVAVVAADGVVAERAARVPGAHLEWLIPTIDALLTAAGLTRDQIDGLAVSIGPGGFSGLRIGLTTAAAWAHALGRPLAAVSTLEVIAAGVPTSGLVLAVLDARRGEVAAALFGRDQDLHRLTDDLLVEPAALHQALPPIAEPVVLAGDALERYGEALAAALAPQAVVAEPSVWWPRASVLGGLARARLLRGERDDPVGLVPRYARRPVVSADPGQEPA
ncbi:MAG: tRNA (adenosine(37)-N6)-threonylcarbamoyltransferase complex dimerization subunit type 1 TsaB [Armatimonadota bacterium]|nr:tRNA (adenosine(37)-N6)-threonylcarbamoyltransferase complex dimerization subunit type 1 TsaB [Armatimonadota bacterium]